MATKLKNKVNPETNSYMCGGIYDLGCGCDVSTGIVIKRVVYCSKCGRRLQRSKR